MKSLKLIRWQSYTSYQETMSRDSIERRNTLSQLVQRFAPVTLRFLMILMVVSGVFAYQVSPLRDSSFQPNSANAGSLLPWMRGVYEDTWHLGSFVLSGLLTINIVLLLWQRNRSRTSRTPKFLLLISWTGLGVILFGLINLLFILYLLSQWLVD